MLEQMDFTESSWPGPGFMEPMFPSAPTPAPTPSMPMEESLTSYMARGHVQYGWQALYDRYKANYFAPGKSRDSLSFDELRVRVLTPDFAYATARFKLSRPPRDSVVASGPFTLVLQRQGDPPRWRILHDHTSADPKP